MITLALGTSIFTSWNIGIIPPPTPASAHLPFMLCIGARLQTWQMHYAIRLSPLFTFSFQPSDWVLLKLQSYRQTSLLHCTSQKLAKRYYGPFQVCQCIDSVAYELILPDTARIHPVFHVSLLRPYKGEDPIRHFQALLP